MWEERIEDRKKKRKEWRNKNPDYLDDQVCDINLFESWKERSNCGTNKGGVRLYIYILSYAGPSYNSHAAHIF